MKKKNTGITLIALVITIIVLLILAGVTIATLTGENGILTQAQNAKRKTKEAEAEEEFALIANEWMIVKKIGDKTLEEFINEKINEGKLTGFTKNSDGTYTIELNGIQKILGQSGEFEDGFDTVGWDKNASSEDCFIWLSDDKNSEDYGTIIGYTSKALGYTTLKYPSRCKRVEFTYNSERYSISGTTREDMRSVRNIKEVELPETVTSIGNTAFTATYFHSLEKINIPKSVSNIGDYAFSNCQSLTSIIIPKSVTNIGNNAFSNCSNLSNITIPEKVTNIGDNAFSNCSNLSNITIPESVTSIGDNAFSNCQSLTSIILPESLTSISNRLFLGCVSLTSIEIPESVTEIDVAAFENCTSLTSITISENVEIIYGSAFENCTSLTDITIPEGVTSIVYGAFQGCTSLNSIKLPESLTSIAENVFYDCISLNSITIPESVTSIGNLAFKNCTGLTSITIPKNVTSIKSGAFAGCSNLESINITPENETYSNKNGIVYNKEQTIAMIIPPGLDKSKWPSNIGILESPHPYSNNMSTYYTKTIEGAAELTLVFDSQCTLEGSYDYIEIYDKNNKMIYTSKNKGDWVLAEEIITLSGDSVKIRFITDRSRNFFGFKCIVQGN